MWLRRIFGRSKAVPTRARVICGLGNPGAQYEDTRHNVGWWFLDHLRDAWGFPPYERGPVTHRSVGERDGEPVVLAKPQTYMNRSGAALASLRRRFEFDPVRDLLVVVDDVSLDPGRVRYRPSGSAGGHNGLRSVESTLGDRSWGRLRIGIGGAPGGRDLADWVLSAPEEREERAIRDTFPALAEGVELWLSAEPDAVMNRINSIG